MKVYCENCKYLIDGDFYPSLNKCKYKNNKKIIQIYRYYNTIKTLRYEKHPGELNKNNSCEWYKRKFWKFWIKDK
jgi:hypothetical protein